MAPLRSGAHLFVLAVLALIVVVMGIMHRTGVIDMSQINAGTAQMKTESSSDASVPSTISSTVPTNTGVYCDRNSKEPHCCSREHCQLVHKSTLYSECCKNIPTKVTTHKHPPKRQRKRFLQAGIQFPTQPPVDESNPVDETKTFGGFGSATPAPRPKAAVARPYKYSAGVRKRPAIYTPKPQVFPILITATPRSGTVFVQRLLSQLGLRVTNDQESPRIDGMVSWMHIFNDALYFGPARVKGSKFRAIWHQVRDPLKALTSLSFTEPLGERNSHSLHYLRFLNRHIKMTKKDDLQAKLMAEFQPQSTTKGGTNETAADKAGLMEQFLIYRGLEFYTQWNRYILSLKLPRISLEDITERKNMTLLDEIFISAGKPPPDHKIAKKIITTDRRRRQLQRQQQRQQQRRLHTNARKHRPTLKWEELCAVSVERTRQFLALSHELGYYLKTQDVC